MSEEQIIEYDVNGKTITVRYDSNEICQVTKECMELLIGLYKQGITDYQTKLSKEMCDLWNWYKKDKQNRPKPDFTNAIAMVDLIADIVLKGE